MTQRYMAYEPMDADEVRHRHRILAALGAASLFIGGWAMVVENMMLLGFAVLAPGALTYGLCSRLAQLSNRLQLAALAIAVAILFGAGQYRSAHSMDGLAPANVPKCGADEPVPAGGCYTVSSTSGAGTK